MIGDSLTLENMQAIKSAMEKIKEIDRSTYFNQYFKEISERLKEEHERLDFLEQRKLKPLN